MNVLLFGALSGGELLLVLVIVLIVFGAGKLPQVGEALGKGIRNFKKASTGTEDVEVSPKPPEAKASLPPATEAKPVVEAEEVKADSGG